MTAPTTRETADHAELADQARRDLEWSCLTTIRPTALLALLSEIAALRGENDRLAYECDGATLVNLELRATQAERQRDELRKALEPFAKMASAGDQRPSDNAVWAGQDGNVIRFGDFRRAAEAIANQGAE